MPMLNLMEESDYIIFSTNDEIYALNLYDLEMYEEENPQELELCFEEQYGLAKEIPI